MSGLVMTDKTILWPNKTVTRRSVIFGLGPVDIEITVVFLYSYIRFIQIIIIKQYSESKQ